MTTDREARIRAALAAGDEYGRTRSPAAAAAQQAALAALSLPELAELNGRAVERSSPLPYHHPVRVALRGPRP